MRAIDFLIENNKCNLVNQLDTKLLAKWKDEGEPFKDEITPADILLCSI